MSLSPSSTALVTAGVVAAISGLVTWLVARRASSGSIDTSEAATLWDEGTVMRRELREEVVSLRQRLAEAIAAITTLNLQIAGARRDTELARDETRKSREETQRLMVQVQILRNETRDVLDEVKVNTVETKHVLDEVKTSNALSIGALADNIESRRILDIPVGQRTPQEVQHLDTAHVRLPDNLRADQGEEKTG